jgi:hypothetical protein
MAFAEPNGSYEFNVSASAPGYLSTNETGTVTVDGAAVSVAITFAQAETVTFTERGVANGQYWELAFDGTEWETPAGTAFAFQALNGSYPFTAYSPGYRVTPSSGTVVVNGKAVSVSISFATATNYAVTFSETGLPTPSPWTAELLLDGSEFSNGSFAVSSTLSVSVPDGNYTWIVEAVIPGYLATPMTGGFAVHGLPVSQSIVFAPVLPNEELLVFTEEEYAVTGTHGAPNGTSWNVSVGGVVQSTTGMYLIFAEQNGSYAYTIGAPSGYAALPASGTLTIDSANVASIYDPAAEVYDAFYPVTDAPLHAAAPGGGPAPLGAAPAGASVSPSAAGARPAPESAVAGRPR